MKKRQTQQRKYPSSTKFHHNDYQDSSFKDKASYLIQSDKQRSFQQFREQLRSALEDLEQHKLKSELQFQKRLVSEQLLKSVKNENQQLREQNQQLRKDLGKIIKKYNKMKDKKECDQCKDFTQLNQKLEKQRAVYFNDRAVLKDQIKALKIQLENSQAAQDRDKLELLVDTLRKQIIAANRKIEQQIKMINFMSQKLSLYQLENIHIMTNLDLLEGKFQQIQFEKSMNRRACPNCCKASLKKKTRPNSSFHEGDQAHEKGYIQHQKLLNNKRKTGSIKNIKHKDEIQRTEYLQELERYQG